MIDKAAIFTSILTKNALRREAGLVEWPVRATFDEECRSASWREYVQLHGARVRAQVLTEQQLRHGEAWPISGGGRMFYSCLVAKALAEGFAAQRAS